MALFNVAYPKRKACQTKKWIAKLILKVIIIISRNCDQMLPKKKKKQSEILDQVTLES